MARTLRALYFIAADKIFVDTLVQGYVRSYLYWTIKIKSLLLGSSEPTEQTLFKQKRTQSA